MNLPATDQTPTKGEASLCRAVSPPELLGAINASDLASKIWIAAPYALKQMDTNWSKVQGVAKC
jgi:hypothetical protein